MPLSANPSRTTNTGRPKVFLVDIEYAKKEEWERRRKLRLKQVRQQARDIAFVIRNQAGHAKKISDDLKKSAQFESTVRCAEKRNVELQERLTECLTSVGTAHTSASMLTEVDELVQHKIELQDTLARVRAELAAEKAKENKKSRQDVMEFPREGISISKLNPTKPAVRPSIRKMSPPKKDLSKQPPPSTPPNLIPVPSLKSAESSTNHIHQTDVRPPSERTIFSPPMLSRLRNSMKTDKPATSTSKTDGRKSCPPMTDSIEAIDSSAESDDSDRTWPPASVKKKKSTKVRMYDHSARKCSEYVQQCGIIRMESPLATNMQRLIQEEENLLLRKTGEELENRRTELQRGLKALREEMAKQDFDSAIKDLCQLNKETRLRKAQNYPASTKESGGGDAATHTEERRGSGQNVVSQSSQKEIPHVGQGDDKTTKHRPPVNVVNEPISAIVSKLNEKREGILHEQSLVGDESSVEGEETEDESEDERSRLPMWLQQEFAKQNNVCDEDITSNRVATPETAVGCMNEARSQKDTDPTKENVSSSATSSGGRSGKSDTTSDKSERTDGKRGGSKLEDDAVGNATASSQSSSSGQINVQIKISKEKSPVKRLSFQTPQKDSGSSTSYYSPPDKLSPQQVSVLSDILSKISVKNRNPVLHYYINRMLNMSRRSLSELEVSGCSDFSIATDLCSSSRMSTPRSRNNVVNARCNVAKDKACLRELDNLSTAGTVCSTPRVPSFENIPAPNHSGQIADLLRNIIDLQRLYTAHSSSDPSSVQLSESHSSYRSVPFGMDANHYRGAAPSLRDGVNYCEDTGIFNNPRGTSSGSDDRPTRTSVLNTGNANINVPSQLYPKPFADSGDEEMSEKGEQPPIFPNIDEIADVPDGYSMRPEWDPTSDFLTRRGNRNAIRFLSDIESVVSSIQSSPTKTKPDSKSSSPAPSPPPRSIDEVSDISSSDFISSREMLNNDLIETSSTGTSDVEDVFRSLGLGWALSTLRRTRVSKNLRAVDSTSKSGGSLPSERSLTYHHSTPVKQSSPAVTREPDENELLPSLTPPSITLQCPTWQK